MLRTSLTLLLLGGCGGPDPGTPDPEGLPTSLTEPEAPVSERCAIDGDDRSCEHETVRLNPGFLATRDVHFQVPTGEAPDDGWPVVLLFQGSFYSAETFWEARRGAPFGGWHQVAVVDALLAAGFAVITPETQGGGNLYWNTNILPWSLSWAGAPDDKLMQALFEEMDAGTFGPLDNNRRAAAGISSGGYMTSRMALSYPGEFSVLAIQSASWATCGGFLCSVPDELPEDHPPTLFLHGESDDIVPISTMETYAERLEDAGHTVEVVTDPDAGHAWLEVAPAEIVDWLTVHLE